MADIEITLNLPNNFKFRKATVFSPDKDTQTQLQVVSSAAVHRFTLPHLGIYAIITVEQ